MAQFLEFKFLIIFKLNLNGGQFKKKFGYFKNLKILQLNKVWNWKCWAFALKNQKLKMLSTLKKLGHWVEGSKGGWIDVWIVEPV